MYIYNFAGRRVQVQFCVKRKCSVRRWQEKTCFRDYSMYTILPRKDILHNKILGFHADEQSCR